MTQVTKRKRRNSRLYTLVNGGGVQGATPQKHAADGKPDPNLTNEVAGLGGDFIRQVGFQGLLLNTDEVITDLAPKKLGKDGKLGVDHYQLHRRMRRTDPKYKSLIKTRKQGVLSKEWRVVPNPSDPDRYRAARAASLVQAVLTGMHDFYSDLNELLEAIPQGFAVSEIMWTKRDVFFAEETLRGAWVPESLLQRRAGRFDFYADGSLAYLPQPARPEPVPVHKFVVHVHERENENPRGTAECAEVFWTYFLKHTFVKWWCIYAEKFGQPTVVGKYKPGASEEQQSKLLEAVEMFQTEYGIIIPDNVVIELLEAQRAGSLVTYQSFCEWADRNMSEAITGQSLATGQGSDGKGSYAQAAVHGQVKQEYIEGDAKELMCTINTQLVRPITLFNLGPDVPAPLWVIDYEAKDLRADLDMDKVLQSMGFPIGKSYVSEKYKRPVAEDDDVLVAPVAANPFGGGGGTDGEYGDGSVANNSKRTQRTAGTPRTSEKNFFAVGKGTERRAHSDARQLDSLTAKVVDLGRPALNAIADEVEKLAAKSADLGELMHRVEQLRAKGQFTRALAEALASAKLNGYLFGAAQIQQQLAGVADKHAAKKVLSDYEPLPPKQAIEWFDELVPMTIEDLQKTYREALAKAFTVAGIEERDVLQRIHDLIGESLRDGGTLQEFKDNYGQLRADAGLDAVKGYEAEQLYRDSTHRAYGAGRVRATRDPEIKQHLMGYQYVAIMDDRTRPEHAALNGFVAEIDDPFWLSHYPPWEYGCRCVAVPVSKHQAETEGIEPSGTVEVDGAEVDPRSWPASPGFRGLGFSKSKGACC